MDPRTAQSTISTINTMIPADSMFSWRIRLRCFARNVSFRCNQ